MYSFLKSNIKISEDYLTQLYDRRILEYASYTVPHLALDLSLQRADKSRRRLYSLYACIYVKLYISI